MRTDASLRKAGLVRQHLLVKDAPVSFDNMSTIDETRPAAENLQQRLDFEDALWDKMWQVHGMAHVWAARAVVPEMVARGEGHFVITASAAGLLNIVESAPYGVTKHAAVAFAEWLRIAYGRRGVRVSCLCPQSVDTDMTKYGTGSAGVNGVLTAAQVAADVVATMREEKFLVLPHPEVAKYFLNKGQDYDRWLGGMQKLYALHAVGTA
jgi:NAD(P)-dependent dehydrogenase (short-subunit alcohol dehydrogenase family)